MKYRLKLELNYLIQTLSLALLSLFLSGCLETSNENTQTKNESTKATESKYNNDFTKATTSNGLSKADLAWHASNTFGWDCSEVISKEELTESYYIIACSNGSKLRVYPRNDAHPKITDSNGNY